VRWPDALRAVRAWLESWEMCRCWKASCDLPRPLELRVLLERVFSGWGLYFYVRWQQTTARTLTRGSRIFKLRKSLNPHKN
jgi:hypothetical protein